jgi:multicomponent Na+:H+ antiporter subunit E
MASDRLRLKTPGGFFWLWGLLTFIWIAANSAFAVELLLTGVLISAVLSYIFTRNSVVWKDVRFTPSRLYQFFLYMCVFMVEIVRANIKMMRYVYAPRININPGIVRIKTRLKTPVGRLALANSIALTPGSLVVEIDGDDLFVHWLDVETTDTDEATRRIAGPFEEYLERAFG